MKIHIASCSSHGKPVVTKNKTGSPSLSNQPSPAAESYQPAMVLLDECTHLRRMIKRRKIRYIISIVSPDLSPYINLTHMIQLCCVPPSNSFSDIDASPFPFKITFITLSLAQSLVNSHWLMRVLGQFILTNLRILLD